MRKSLVTLAAAASVALSVACSNGGSAGLSTAPNLSRSGIANAGLIGRGRQMVPQRVRPDKAGGPKELFVDDVGKNAVKIFANSSWARKGGVTKGIDGPGGNWVDKTRRNLYVANYQADNITEYAPGAKVPTFTYASGMNDPVGVTTDFAGNVYEADFAGGFVNEYSQHSDAVIATCSPGGSVEGVAVDNSANVFVDYYTGSEGKIVEYFRGLSASGCVGKVLGVTFKYPGGMVLDQKGDLYVCDQLGPSVDFISYPYKSVTKTLGSGWVEPLHVTASRALGQIYVADYGAADVQVLAIPKGKVVATLGARDGLSLPTGAVDGVNLAP
ncbi:MAG: hypothetical protein WBW76_12440 [Candidatus Cybelea sp.]